MLPAGNIIREIMRDKICGTRHPMFSLLTRHQALPGSSPSIALRREGERNSDVLPDPLTGREKMGEHETDGYNLLWDNAEEKQRDESTYAPLYSGPSVIYLHRSRFDPLG
jgi:hypothetical protein